MLVKFKMNLRFINHFLSLLRFCNIMKWKFLSIDFLDIFDAGTHRQLH